ncbi:organic hydroperoxide resistance protein [Saccharothrix sp. NPDC042600]|uniref:organic hydroperoxide resistance protein n=1 Tax=Saccharothrix TaxID=2071 RepID=UPI0033E0BE8E|nr:organic hydroperoxide resistance protein [Saccharothrix mutabilis subsp. capreolus]
MPETTYTAIATSTAEGRNGGRATSDDGVLDVTLAVPKAFGGSGDGTNPEQLFAAGWASCFVGAVRRVAAKNRVAVRDLSVTAEVTLHHEDDEFFLSAVLNLEVSGVDQATADELARGAHRICPYSKSTRDNIDVTLSASVAK